MGYLTARSVFKNMLCFFVKQVTGKLTEHPYNVVADAILLYLVVLILKTCLAYHSQQITGKLPASYIQPAFLGSNPPSPTLFTFLYRAKKRKKYTSVFDRFRALKTKNRASKQPIDCSEALLCLILPVFCTKCRKKRLLPW